ncbi:MAG: hypothetical protein EZS28_048507 [Streblomastix strix]|uniref:Uncharacterized protein n=1 Tax=Streblomastix strix TaxID=222440 RepID=A0A5J4TC13_9EUKA|nr:MAG: hypothetical protein EZS28_048507 [Streblomastix strix]
MCLFDDDEEEEEDDDDEEDNMSYGGDYNELICCDFTKKLNSSLLIVDFLIRISIRNPLHDASSARGNSLYRLDYPRILDGADDANENEDDDANENEDDDDDDEDDDPCNNECFDYYYDDYYEEL